MEAHGRIPIWFFIGALLVVYGLMILAVGLYHLAVPPPLEARVKLFEYHADIWWGLLMTLVGAAYVVRFWPWRTTDAPTHLHAPEEPGP